MNISVVGPLLFWTSLAFECSLSDYQRSHYCYTYQSPVSAYRVELALVGTPLLEVSFLMSLCVDWGGVISCLTTPSHRIFF